MTGYYNPDNDFLGDNTFYSIDTSFNTENIFEKEYNLYNQKHLYDDKSIKLKNYGKSKNYGNIRYNVPLKTNFNSTFKSKSNFSNNRQTTKIFNIKNNFTSRFFAKHFATQAVYYATDSKYKIDAINEDIVMDLAKNYLNGKIRSLLFNQGVKAVIRVGASFSRGPYTTTATAVYNVYDISKNSLKLAYSSNQVSSCLINEHNFMSDNDMLNYYNVNNSVLKCMSDSFYSYNLSKMSLGKNVMASMVKASIDVYNEKMYIPNSDLSIEQKIHSDLKLKEMNYEGIINKSYRINNFTRPIFNGIEISKEVIKDAYLHLKDVGNTSIDMAKESIQDLKSYFNNNKSNIDTTTNNHNTDGENSEQLFEDTCKSSDNCLNLCDVDFKTLDEMNEHHKNAKHQDLTSSSNNKKHLNIDIEKCSKELTKISKFVSACNMIKNLEKMNDVQKLVQLEALLVSLKTSDQLVNGVFDFFINFADKAEIEFKNVLNLAVSAAEKYLNLPLKSAVRFVTALYNGENNIVADYFKPLVLEISSFIVPTIGLLNLSYSIIKGIEYFFSSQSIKKIDGIDFLYTDNLKIGFFKITHEISYDNEFFGIHIECSSRNRSNAVEYCNREFQKQLDHKVYQVIGVPIEFVNGTIEKPNTRLGIYTQRFYLDNLQRKWIDVNGNLLKEDDLKLVERNYFENQSDKDYRNELAKKGQKPSWYWENKRDNILVFISRLSKLISNNQKRYLKNMSIHSFQDCINSLKKFITFLKKSYQDIINNRGCQIDNNLSETESKKVNDLFVNARNSRNRNHNNQLDNYRNSQRNQYNDLRGDFSTDEIIRRACYELYVSQQSMEYLVQTGYSSAIGFLGSFFANIDIEILKIIHNPFKYPFIKVYDYFTSVTQGHITRILVDQTTLWYSLLESTQHLSDEFLSNYINPFISSSIGLGIGIIRYIFTWDKRKHNFKSVLFNGAISAINSSFGMIYTYLKDKTFLSKYLGSDNWENLMSFISDSINYWMKINLSVNFVSGVSTAMLFNLMIRMGGFLYTSIQNFYNKYSCDNTIINEILVNNTLTDVVKNPIISDINRNSVISDIGENTIKSDIEDTEQNFRSDIDKNTTSSCIELNHQQIIEITNFNSGNFGNNKNLNQVCNYNSNSKLHNSKLHNSKLQNSTSKICNYNNKLYNYTNKACYYNNKLSHYTNKICNYNNKICSYNNKTSILI